LCNRAVLTVGPEEVYEIGEVGDALSQRYEADPNAGRGDDGPRVSRRSLMMWAGALALGGAFAGDPLGSRAFELAVRSTPLYGLAKPPIMSCDQWHARQPSSPVDVVKKPARMVMVHHTAPSSPQNESVTLGALARGIQNDHMDRQHWIDSGQHFLINRAGQIAEGRHRSLEALNDGSFMIFGSHCPDWNDIAIGIENQGNYMTATPPAAMLATLKTMCAYTCVRYGIDPSQIVGHRDHRDTDCPGDRLYALLPSLRSGAAALIKRRAATPLNAATWPLLRFNDKGPHVLAAQHLLRNAGVPGVPADGVFGATTSVGVLAYQREHKMEQTGMIAGGSWPLLAVPVKRGQGGEGEAAVQALLAAQPGRAWQPTLPDTVAGVTWQRLLGTG